MTGITDISEVDPFDDDAFAAFHHVYFTAQRHALDDDPPIWTLADLVVAFRQPNRRQWQGAFVAREDGVAVASGWMMTPLVDNLDAATVMAFVLPEHRRRGHGTRMLRHLEQVAAERGRTLLDAEVSWPHDLGADAPGWPGVEFARAGGFALTLGDVQRQLTLPVEEALLDRLAAEAAPHHADYTLRSWVGDVPDDIVVSWLALSSTLMTEAPMGEKELEPETPDIDALREGEATVAKQGRTRYNTVALDAAGEVAAYTDLVAGVNDRGRAYQWGTLVRRDARGHRLGLAVKVANHRLLQREAPGLHTVVTFNAEVNSHMIEVNERLGFEPVLRLGEFQKRVG